MDVTVLCYIEDHDRYLMLYRNKKANDLNAGKYIGIGGHLEHGESPYDCLMREAYEETGLKLIDPCLRGIITYVIDDYDECAFLYTCKNFAGELGAGSEGELVFVQKGEVAKLPLWPGDKLMFSLLEERNDLFLLKLVYQNDELISATVQ